MRNNLIELFPLLANYDPFEITSPETNSYNCIAWAYGLTKDKMWPGIPRYYYWPEGLPTVNNLNSFIKLFEDIGYISCVDGSLEDGFLKVALYCKDDIPQHAARQLPDGTWTSKIGDLEDINHSINGISDTDYGKVVQYLKRRV